MRVLSADDGIGRRALDMVPVVPLSLSNARMYRVVPHLWIFLGPVSGYPDARNRGHGASTRDSFYETIIAWYNQLEKR